MTLQWAWRAPWGTCEHFYCLPPWSKCWLSCVWSWTCKQVILRGILHTLVQVVHKPKSKNSCSTEFHWGTQVPREVDSKDMFGHDVDSSLSRMLEKGDGCLLPRVQTRKMLYLQLLWKWINIFFCEKACTCRLHIRFMLSFMCHLWRMKNCRHYCSQVPPLAPKQITAEFLGRKEHISEDRPFPPYPVLSRQSSCEVTSMWLDVDKGCFTDMEIMLIAWEWGVRKEFFRQREEHKQAKRQK